MPLLTSSDTTPHALQIVNKGGYVKRAGEDKAPPPSYSRRGVDEGAQSGSAGPSRQSSASLSRKNSAALPGRAVVAGEGAQRHAVPLTGALSCQPDFLYERKRDESQGLQGHL